MSEYVIRLSSLAAGWVSPIDGQYVVTYDPAAPPPPGSDLLCLLETSPDKSNAKRFDSPQEAVTYWQQSHGIREDGQPQRYLTAFSIWIEEA